MGSAGTKQALPTGVALPDWLPLSPWREYKAMRVKIKSPLSPGAEARCLPRLAKFREDGWDVGALLELAVDKTWKGIYLPKSPDDVDRCRLNKPSPLIGSNGQPLPGGSDGQANAVFDGLSLCLSRGGIGMPEFDDATRAGWKAVGGGSVIRQDPERVRSRFVSAYVQAGGAR